MDGLDSRVVWRTHCAQPIRSSHLRRGIEARDFVLKTQRGISQEIHANKGT